MIREATQDDIEQILIMCAHFWENTDYEEEFNAEDTRVMVQSALSQGLLAVAEVEAGVIGFVAGIKGPLMANHSVLTGTELAWWIEPEHRKGRLGIDLMLYIESLARIQGVKYWNMISMESSNPEVANRIYKRLGYIKSETSFTKVI